MLERVTTHGRRLFEGFLPLCALSHPPSEEGPPATCGSASRVARRPAGRTALTLLIGGSVGLAAGTASCSLVLGIQDPIVDAGQDATTHPKSDASSDSGKADVAPGKDVRTAARPWTAAARRRWWTPPTATSSRRVVPTLLAAAPSRLRARPSRVASCRRTPPASRSSMSLRGSITRPSARAGPHHCPGRVELPAPSGTPSATRR